ncbi:hypothetical protein DFR50_12847 [Roseiarcus fermentans]|uniref:Uncharacterized protein n=1 Tax=Roseiarcus fermentans TaxID=1473586 RepID=A0A366EY56_9HYPH|nr:hypothetical protein [Roseiarcus fermentans]RBP07322.1 hypothetical protein DFR50_12847 [Roseiarcus fermentans]
MRFAKETRIGDGEGFRAFPADAALDGRTATYVLKAQAGFDALRNAAAQLAALLVLVSIGKRDRVLDEPILAQAETAFKEAEDILGAIEAPAAAAHHHFHLSLARERIGEALRIARQGSLRIDEPSLDRAHQTLKAGWREMLAGSKALPGFQVVDFSQSCCAAHRGLRERRIEPCSG